MPWMGFPYPAPTFGWRKDISHVQLYANVCIHELSKEWKMTVMHVLSHCKQPRGRTDRGVVTILNPESAAIYGLFFLRRLNQASLTVFRAMIRREQATLFQVHGICMMTARLNIRHRLPAGTSERLFLCCLFGGG